MRFDILDNSNAPGDGSWVSREKENNALKALSNHYGSCIFAQDMSDIIENYVKDSKETKLSDFKIVKIVISLDDRKDLCTQIARQLSYHEEFRTFEFSELYNKLKDAIAANDYAHADDYWHEIVDYIDNSSKILLVFFDFDEYEFSIGKDEIIRLEMLMDADNIHLWFVGQRNSGSAPYRNFNRFLDRIKVNIDKQKFEEFMEDEKESYIYISYNWEEKSNNTVNHLEYVLKSCGFAVIRDKHECTYRENIRSFMEAIRQGQYVIVVLSKKYLESENCMLELSGVMQHPDYEHRIFPIVCEEGKDNIRDDKYYISLVQKWQKIVAERKDNVEKMKAIDETKMADLEDKYNEATAVYDLISEIKKYIDYTNAPSSSNASNTNFSQIIESIQKQMEVNRTNE